MKSRTTLFLVIGALIVAGVVLLDYYKGTPTERAETLRKRIIDFQPQDITRLELVKTNQTITLEKTETRWNITQPIAVPASASAVSSILDELEFAERSRRLTSRELSGIDLKEFGLTTPRVAVTLDGKRGPVTLLVGGETPTKDALYLQFKGSAEVLVGPKSIFDRLDQTLDHLRDRAAIDFTPATATRVEMKTADRVLELSKPAAATAAEPRWAITRPLAARADQTKVSELLRGLQSLRVLDFVSEDPKDLHMYQLGEPEREITVWSGEAGKTLLLGRPLTNDASKVYAKLKSANSIFTVSAADAHKFAWQANDIRDARVLPVSPTDVRGLEILHGADRVAIVRTNADWEIAEPQKLPADEPIIRETLNQLTGLMAEKFIADVATDLDKYGLATPAITATLIGEGTNTIAQLLVGSLDEARAYRFVKRADEPFVYAITTNIVDLLPPGSLPYRSRRIAGFTPEQISKLVIQKPTGPIVLERDADAKWRLVEPAQGALDNDGLARLLDGLAQLRAQDFLKDSRENLAEYGLDAPSMSLTVTVGGKNYTLELGKLRDADHRYAAWSDPPLILTLWTTQADVLTRDIVTGSTAPPANPVVPAEVVTPPAVPESFSKPE